MNLLKFFALIILLTGIGQPLSLAKINFTEIKKQKINLNDLKINKEVLFRFLENSIKGRKKGLGTYGRVSLVLCNLPIAGRPLSDYKTEKGREIRFLSNPSCGQLILAKVLEDGYLYEQKALSGYDNRRCLLVVEKIFSPLLEYYTILYEERGTECEYCAQQERERLVKISSVQAEITDKCSQESGKVLKFLDDLDQVIEKAYQSKSGGN